MSLEIAYKSIIAASFLYDGKCKLPFGTSLEYHTNLLTKMIFTSEAEDFSKAMLANPSLGIMDDLITSIQSKKPASLTLVNNGLLNRKPCLTPIDQGLQKSLRSNGLKGRDVSYFARAGVSVEYAAETIAVVMICAGVYMLTSGRPNESALFQIGILRVIESGTFPEPLSVALAEGAINNIEKNPNILQGALAALDLAMTTDQIEGIYSAIGIDPDKLHREADATRELTTALGQIEAAKDTVDSLQGNGSFPGTADDGLKRLTAWLSDCVKDAKRVLSEIERG